MNCGCTGDSVLALISQVIVNEELSLDGLFYCIRVTNTFVRGFVCHFA